MGRFAGAAEFFGNLLKRGATLSDDAIAKMPAGVHEAAATARLQNLTRVGVEGAEQEAQNVYRNYHLAQQPDWKKALDVGLPGVGQVGMNAAFSGVMGAQMMQGGATLPQAAAVAGWGAGVPLGIDMVAGPLAAWIARKSAPAGMAEMALQQRAEGWANIAKTGSMVGSFLIPNLPAEHMMKEQQEQATAQQRQQQLQQQQPISSMGVMTGNTDPFGEDDPLEQAYRAQMASA